MKNMNEKINKWKPILDCLNMSDTSLYEPLVIFAEEKNKIDFLKTLYTLPISLKILSKLDLTNKKLIVDTENKYQVDDYELSIDVKEVVVGDHLQYQIRTRCSSLC